jgi:HK97 family phage portal protein
MGLFDFIFRKPKEKQASTFFETLTSYTPMFTTWSGEIFESELVRAAIDARARHICKLKVQTIGTAKKPLQLRLKSEPNEFQSWSQFLYRLSTILDIQCTAFIVPILGTMGEIQGIFPILPSNTSLVQDDNGNPWIRYRFVTGQIAALPLMEAGILTKFQYKDDFFGTPNTALSDTMSLIDLQNQGVSEAVKNSNTFRFMARVNNFSFAEDLKKERERFTRENFSKEAGGGGLLLFPNTYDDIKQIDYHAYSINPKERELIQTNVFNYFGVNEDVLQNKLLGDSWGAFYEGAIEPFAIQFSDVLSRMLFTKQERNAENRVIATANRMQYMSNKDKLNMIAAFMDRGIFTINESREILNLDPVEGGDIRTVRGEYKNADEVNEDESGNIAEN